MTTDASSAAADPAATVNPAYRLIYRIAAYFGLMSIFGSLVAGVLLEDMNAPVENFGYNLAVYGGFIVLHLIMTRSWFKRALWGNPAGSPRERRVYIATSVATWFAVLYLQRPLPYATIAFPDGLVALHVPGVLRFAGFCAFLASFLLFFQGISFAMIDGLLGVPGAAGGYTHGAATPLFTEGAYAEVRHPMYRAVLLAGISALIYHPTLAQVFWTALIGGSFIAFIPVEEAQLIAARGDDYRKYRECTPYRLFKGIW